MKNRAKCKLCSSIIESFHPTDYIFCKCGEISLYGADKMLCAAKHWENFLRIDDEGNEIIPKILKSGSTHPSDEADKKDKDTPSSNGDNNQHTLPSKKELIDMLSEMIKNIENLPQHAMNNPINHYDFSSLLILLVALFKDDDCKDVI